MGLCTLEGACKPSKMGLKRDAHRPLKSGSYGMEHNSLWKGEFLNGEWVQPPLKGDIAQDWMQWPLNEEICGSSLQLPLKCAMKRGCSWEERFTFCWTYQNTVKCSATISGDLQNLFYWHFMDRVGDCGPSSMRQFIVTSNCRFRLHVQIVLTCPAVHSFWPVIWMPVAL